MLRLFQPEIERGEGKGNCSRLALSAFMLMWQAPLIVHWAWTQSGQFWKTPGGEPHPSAPAHCRRVGCQVHHSKSVAGRGIALEACPGERGGTGSSGSNMLRLADACSVFCRRLGLAWWLGGQGKCRSGSSLCPGLGADFSCVLHSSLKRGQRSNGHLSEDLRA